MSSNPKSSTNTKFTTNSDGREPNLLEEVPIIGAPFALLHDSPAITIEVAVEQGLLILEDLLLTAKIGSTCLRETSKASAIKQIAEAKKKTERGTLCS